MKKILITLPILLLTAGMIFALTQTGNLIVTVNSEEGQVLPGATVTVSSPALMGTRTQTTGTNGKAYFRQLPPGEYVAEITMDGFQTFRREEIVIRIAKTTQIDVPMKLGEARETIMVAATTPLVDTTSSTVTEEFDFDQYINHMPIGRHYNRLLGLSGGTTPGNNPMVLGATGGDNAYLIDGINTSDTKTQTWGCQFTHDSIADVNVMTGGVPAEYGGMMGAVANIVTKSGSNQLHGMARFEMKRAAWNDVSERNPDREDDNRQLGSDDDQWDYTGGGPLYPDVLWWFVGYHPSSSRAIIMKQLNPMDPSEFTPCERPYLGRFFNMKGTLQIGEDLKVTGFFKEDPIDIPNLIEVRNIYGLNSSAWLGNVQPGTGGMQTQGGQGYLGSATWVFMENAFLTVRYWHDGNWLNITENPEGDGFPTNTGADQPTFFSADRWVWGGRWIEYLSDRNKDAMAAEINYLLDTESLGSHDIKIGFEYADHNTGTAFWYGNRNNGTIIYTSAVENVGFDNVKWLEKEVTTNYLPKDTAHLYYYSNFIQDSIQLTDKLTLNIGLRTDPVIGENLAGDEIINIGPLESIAPRLGFAYDFEGNSLHGSVGRYYDSMSMYIVSQMNYFPTAETHSFYRAIGGDGEANGWEATPYNVITMGDPDNPHSVDENLTANYMDEITLGYAHLFTNDLSASGYFVWRTWRDLNSMWDSGADEDGVFEWKNLETDDYGTKYKQYMTFILDARKRPTADNLFLNANFTFVIFDEGFATHSVSTGGYGSYGDQTTENADKWWHDYGNPPWRAKLQGTYFFPNNWYAGLTLDYTAGFSYTSFTYLGKKYVPDGSISTYDYPNGWNDLGRLDPVPTVDLQFGFEQTIEFPFEVPFTDNNILLGLYINFNNLINFEGPTSLDASMDSTNYGKHDDWMNARSYILGFRIEL